jgi:hypothetical protein
MDTNRIILSKSAQSWIATFEGPHSQDIIRLFKTQSIPTAFTLQADANTVLAEIKRSNPGIEVVLAQV